MVKPLIDGTTDHKGGKEKHISVTYRQDFVLKTTQVRTFSNLSFINVAIFLRCVSQN